MRRRPIDPIKYQLPYDTIDLNKHEAYVLVGGKFHRIPGSRITLSESEPVQTQPDQPRKLSAEEDLEIVRALDSLG